MKSTTTVKKVYKGSLHYKQGMRFVVTDSLSKCSGYGPDAESAINAYNQCKAESQAFGWS